MTKYLTNRQIINHIKKEVLNKYPSITKISISLQLGVVTLVYQGGCNSFEMQDFLNQYGSYYSEGKEYQPQLICIDEMDCNPYINRVHQLRTFNHTQCKKILNLIKEFAQANNKVVNLNLYLESNHFGWVIDDTKDQLSQVLIRPGQTYQSTHTLSNIIKTKPFLLDESGCITVGTLYHTLKVDINFDIPNLSLFD